MQKEPGSQSCPVAAKRELLMVGRDSGLYFMSACDVRPGGGVEQKLNTGQVESSGRHCGLFEFSN